MGKRKARRDRGKAKEEAALRARYPGHTIIRGALRLAVMPRDLKTTIEFLRHVDEVAAKSTQPVLLDLYNAIHIDAGACVLLAAAMHKSSIACGSKVAVRMPRNGSARFALAAFGVAADDHVNKGLLQEAESKVMKVTSGMKGDPSPGAKTFEVARLAEDLVADETLADRVHAALNEAADNVLSWAYGKESEPNSTQRWWVAGLLHNRRATFIALDNGASIPATAPQNLGDALTGLIQSMIKDKEFRSINRKPTDAQILLATIRQRRTVSGLGERGKGLNNMIALIDLFTSGFITIFSGDAVYSYRNPAPKSGQKEQCKALGFHFPGTLVLWQLKALEARN